MNSLHRLLTLPLLLTTPMLVAEDGPVVNNSVTAASLSADEVRDLFLGRKANWADGSKVVVVVAKDNDNLMTLLGKSSSQFTTSWKKLVFTGKGVMPEIVDSPDAVAAMVAKTPGAIGFIDTAKAAGCKAVPMK